MTAPKQIAEDSQIMYDLYTELYARATPPANFGYLLFTCPVDEEGRKVIPYWEHEIADHLTEDIVKEHLYHQKDIKSPKLINEYIRRIRSGPSPTEDNPYKAKRLDNRRSKADSKGIKSRKD